MKVNNKHLNYNFEIATTAVKFIDRFKIFSKYIFLSVTVLDSAQFANFYVNYSAN